MAPCPFNRRGPPRSPVTRLVTASTADELEGEVRLGATIQNALESPEDSARMMPKLGCGEELGACSLSPTQCADQ
jgi:hypothetical protein